MVDKTLKRLKIGKTVAGTKEKYRFSMGKQKAGKYWGLKKNIKHNDFIVYLHQAGGPVVLKGISVEGELHSRGIVQKSGKYLSASFTIPGKIGERYDLRQGDVIKCRKAKDAVEMEKVRGGWKYIDYLAVKKEFLKIPLMVMNEIGVNVGDSIHLERTEFGLRIVKAEMGGEKIEQAKRAQRGRRKSGWVFLEREKRRKLSLEEDCKVVFVERVNDGEKEVRMIWPSGDIVDYVELTFLPKEIGMTLPASIIKCIGATTRHHILLVEKKIRLTHPLLLLSWVLGVRGKLQFVKSAKQTGEIGRVRVTVNCRITIPEKVEKLVGLKEAFSREAGAHVLVQDDNRLILEVDEKITF